MRLMLGLGLALAACDGDTTPETPATETAPVPTLEPAPVTRADGFTTSPDIPALTSKLTELVRAAGHTMSGTSGLPIEVSVEKARYAQASADTTPAGVTDAEIIEKLFGANPNAPLTWQVLATWEASGTRAWLVSSVDGVGAGNHDVRMLTLHDGQLAKWPVGGENRVNCGDHTTFTATVSEAGVLTAIRTAWSEDCPADTTSEKVVTKVDYGLDGSVHPHP